MDQIKTAKKEIYELYKEFFLFYDQYFYLKIEGHDLFGPDIVEAAFKEIYYRVKQREKIVKMLERAEYQE